MRKTTFCISDNKGADQLCSNCEADQAFVFATQIVHPLFYLYPKIQASSLHRRFNVSKTTLLVFS